MQDVTEQQQKKTKNKNIANYNITAARRVSHRNVLTFLSVSFKGKTNKIYLL